MDACAEGDRVMVDLNAGLFDEAGTDWQPGTVVGPAGNGMYRVRLDQPIGGREAEKLALPEHIRPLTTGKRT